MGKLTPPPGTIAVWFAHTGSWVTREDLFVSQNRDKTIAWANQCVTTKKIKVSAAHIMYIKGKWYKVQVNPVACLVPKEWGPVAIASRFLKKETEIRIVDNFAKYSNDINPAMNPHLDALGVKITYTANKQAFWWVQDFKGSYSTGENFDSWCAAHADAETRFLTDDLKSYVPDVKTFNYKERLRILFTGR